MQNYIGTGLPKEPFSDDGKTVKIGVNSQRVFEMFVFVPIK
jgi:hypothetical protein